MARVKRGVAAHQKHKKVLKLAKGYRGSRSRHHSQAKDAVMHAGQYAYVGRRLKKRNFRSLWVARVSAALKPHDITYSRFMGALKTKGIALNRKVISEMAIHAPEAFGALVAQAKA